MGVDIQDDRDAAEGFPREFPSPYPHIYDRDAEAVASLDWSQVSPTTWFIDQRGEIVHQRPGAYASRDQLEADLRRFLLSGYTNELFQLNIEAQKLLDRLGLNFFNEV